MKNKATPPIKQQSKLDKYFKKVESTLSSNVKVFIGAALLYVGFLGYLGYKAQKDKSITDATVMITRLDGGGGSGVVITNMPTFSTILTNKHVCEVVQNGGIVSTTQGKKALVISYATDIVHDLCLIEVASDLGVSAKLASAAPKLFSEAIVSGHPNLLPNVVSKGHFSGTKIIQVLTGMTPCTKELVEKNPDIAGVCLFFGGLPIVKTYESQLVTAMIMAGSSGSAVYNESGEISGLVFAGSNGLSYAYTVPYEYVKGFVNNRESLEYVLVDYNLDIMEELGKENKTSNYNSYILDKCTKTNSTSTDPRIKEYCDLIIRDLNFRRGSIWK